jgi:hypothetical protein
MHLKCQKCIGDDVGGHEIRFYKNKTIFFLVKMSFLIHFIHLLFIMQEYDSKCHKMYLMSKMTIKVFLKFAEICLCRSPKSIKGSKIHLAPSTLEVTYSSG